MKPAKTALAELDDICKLNKRKDSTETNKNSQRFKIYSLPINYQEASDEALVNIYLNNQNKEALSQIFKRYGHIITGFAIKLTKNPQDAEEVRQDVFLILVKKLNTFKGNSKFSTWLYKITLNTCYKYLRYSTKRTLKERHLDENLLSDLQPSTIYNASPDQVALRHERMELIKNAVNDLSEGSRLIFTLKEVEGFSNAEVGKMTGLSVSAIKSRALRTRLAIKERISSYFDS